MVEEKIKDQPSGWFALIASLSVIILSVLSLIIIKGSGLLIVLSVLVLIFSSIILGGLFTLEPNESVVLILFGKYVGTVKEDGFKWANPLYQKKKVSLRVRNFDSEKLKVNDKKGNPIEISAVVVWKVKNTAQAVFEVEDYNNFILVQTDSAVRHIATRFAYDQTEGEIMSLRSSIEEVSEELKKELQDRVKDAGIEIIESRINHLAYAPEIAGAMLQRQQAEAVIDARTKIVDGAVGMVEMALKKLSEENIVKLDEDKKADMVSNLMVILCSDRAAQPIINAGNKS